jgi:hypothetical protein
MGQGLIGLIYILAVFAVGWIITFPVLYAVAAMAKPAREPHLPPLYRPSELPKARPRQQRAVADGSV